VNRFEVAQIAAVRVGTVREALEAHHARQARDPHRLAEKLDGFSPRSNRVEVERWQTAAQQVDDAATTVDTKMLRAGDVCGGQNLAIAQTPPFHPLEKAQHGSVRIYPVRDEQIAVLGGTNVTVIDHAESSDHHVVEPDRVGVGYDTGEVRTRELV